MLFNQKPKVTVDLAQKASSSTKKPAPKTKKASKTAEPESVLPPGSFQMNRQRKKDFKKVKKQRKRAGKLFHLEDVNTKISVSSSGVGQTTR